ncbi:hypothetical protein LTR78_005937 [Recurvomyces mirabilis]|uniref:Rhodopsin domain-containing protein n=1 Tax=Recurvomyces mirabilis TaxID=574656 RepID=A0AAE0WLR7_9PEZI|nr:hypothetical protein LTR78_005937 [Recurvomyces mirabilis]KAK5155253.1 hypothetical protein LTS14_006208 [Recurvomyces mirabilis]
MSPPHLTAGWVYGLESVPSTTEAGKIIAIAIAFSIISLVSVLVRFTQRWKLLHTIGLDDVASAGSMLFGVAYCSIAIYQTRWGLGLDAKAFPDGNAVQFSRVQYTGGPIYCLAIMGFKVSLLAGYLRLAGFNKTYRIVLYITLGMVISNQLIYTFLLSFACQPIAKQWDPALPGHCIDQLATYFGLGGSSLGFDILIILLPFPILRRLQLDTKKKAILGGLFALGFFVTIIQAIRIHTIANLATYTDSQPIITWSMVEIHLGVFISCVPSFAPLLRKFGERVGTQYHSSGAGKPSRDKYGNSAVKAEHVGDSNTSRTQKSKKTFSYLSREALDEHDDEIELWRGPEAKGRNGKADATIWGAHTNQGTVIGTAVSTPHDETGYGAPDRGGILHSEYTPSDGIFVQHNIRVHSEHNILAPR